MSNSTQITGLNTSTPSSLAESVKSALGASLLTTLLALCITQKTLQALLIGALQFIANLALVHFKSKQPKSSSAAVPARSSDQLTLEPCVIWFTGLPSAGKTTLSLLLKDLFESLGLKIEHLDGDTVRAIVPGIGFSRSERNDHIRRMGFLASRLESQGITVIASFVSPYCESRDFVRRICKNFIEVYLSTSIDECTRRDVKGLYGQSMAGKRNGMTGVDDPYEPPTAPELVLDTASCTKEQCIETLRAYLISRGLLREKSEHPNGEMKRLYGSSLAT